MADLISRAAAIDAIISETIYPDRETIDKVCGASYSEDNGWVGGIRDAINAVEEVNAVDAVPVVRCKDCKYRIVNENYGKRGYMKLKAVCDLDTGDCFQLGRNAENDDWFCADGERRESE